MDLGHTRFDIVALVESRKFTASENTEPGNACQLQMSHVLSEQRAVNNSTASIPWDFGPCLFKNFAHD